MLTKIFDGIKNKTEFIRFILKPELITPEGICLSVTGLPSQDGTNDKPQNQPGWEHEEMALLVVEYFYYKNSPSGIKKSNQFISDLLRKRGAKLGINVGEKYRNLHGIESQRINLSHFDPESNIPPTGHESKWMKDIMEEYLANPEVIRREAYEMIKKYSM